MIALPLYVIFIAITAWGFFSTVTAGWTFVVLVSLFAAWLLLASRSLRTKWIRGLPKDSLTWPEEEIFRKYAFYFIYPFQAKQYSSTFSMIQILCIVWMGLCIWKQTWVVAGCIAVLFVVSSNMAAYLNQGLPSNQPQAGEAKRRAN